MTRQGDGATERGLDGHYPVAVMLTAGCATRIAPEAMVHPDYTGAALEAGRSVAIDRCEQENASMGFVAFRNEANMDTGRGLAQQGRRISEMAAFQEAVVACMRRNGWRFP